MQCTYCPYSTCISFGDKLPWIGSTLVDRITESRWRPRENVPYVRPQLSASRLIASDRSCQQAEDGVKASFYAESLSEFEKGTTLTCTYVVEFSSMYQGLNATFIKGRLAVRHSGLQTSFVFTRKSPVSWAPASADGGLAPF